MNIDLENAINYLQRLKQKIEDKTASPGFIHADLEDKFKEGLFKPLFELASQPKTQFHNLSQLWNQIEAEAQKQTTTKKGLRLCKVEPNTDSFYFHEFIIDKTALLTEDLKPAPQHSNCYLPSLFTTALVEDKKGRIFIADAEYLKFID